MNTATKMLLGILPGARLAGGGGDAPLEFLLRDDFLTDEAAPLASPRTAEPGPGAWTVTQTSNLLSISGSDLIAGGNSAIEGTHIESVATFARATGRAVAGKVSDGFNILIAGWARGNGGWGYWCGVYRGDAIRIFSEVLATRSVSTGDAYAVVMTSFGYLVFVRDSSQWILSFVIFSTSNSPYRASIHYYQGVAPSFSVDNTSVIDLPAPFDADYGLVTDRLAGSVSEAATFAHEANFLLYGTASISSSTLRIDFRIQDASNYWSLFFWTSGSVQLLETVAGINTQRATAASGISTNTPFALIADGSTIRFYSNDVLRWTYSSASAFVTETDGKVAHIDPASALADLVVWPRAHTGAAAAILDAAVA